MPRACNRLLLPLRATLLSSVLSSVALLGLGLAPSALAVPPTPAEEPRLTGDLVTGPDLSDLQPRDYLRYGDLVYFSALDPLHGAELWRTDGTSVGTERFLDLCPGPCDSGATPRLVAGGFLYFEAGDSSVDGTSSRGLWRTDGTAAGTVLLAPRARAQVALGDRVLFTVDTSPDGPEMGVTDGTVAGTEIFDLCPGALCGIEPRSFVVLGDGVGDEALFSATLPDEGRELWATDGTLGGTRQISDICPGQCSARVSDLVLFGDDRVAFSAFSPSTSFEPFVSDGTPGGTELLVDSRPGRRTTNPRGLVSAHGRLYYVAGDSGQVWSTDGTAAGTGPATELEVSNPHLLAALGEVLYYRERTGAGESLWAYTPEDGARRLVGPVDQVIAFTDAGTFYSQGPPGIPGDPAPPGALVWIVRQAAPGELLYTRGTVATTEPIETGLPTVPFRAALELYPFGGELLISLATFEGIEPWITDGTAGSAEELVRSPLPLSSNPTHFTPFGDRTYFLAGPEGQRALWRTGPGDVGPAELVHEPDGTLSYRDLVRAGDRLYGALSGPPILVTPPVGRIGALTITTLGGDLIDVTLDPGRPRHLTAVGDRLFFTAAGAGQRLWVSDGTAAGTRQVLDLDPSWEDSGIDETTAAAELVLPRLAALGDDRVLLFASQEPNPDSIRVVLWTSDGTAAGTDRVFAGPDLGPTFGTEMVRFGDRVLFVAAFGLPDGSLESTVGVSDGSAAGTMALVSLDELREWEAGHLTPAGDRAFFTTEDRFADRSHLWVTGGSPATTRKIRTFGRPGEASAVGEMVALGPSRVALTAVTRELGEEVWLSDGTPAGTGLLEDLVSGPESSQPQNLAGLDGDLFFAATTDLPDLGLFGHELWIAEGFPEVEPRSLSIYTDIAPGGAASSPGGFALNGDRLHFAATDPTHGREPWSVRLQDLDGGGGGGGGGGAVPPRPQGPPLVSPAVPGFRFWVRITNQQGEVQPTALEPACIAETACISGALPGRAELFLRVIGPRPNGFLWPILVRFTPSEVEVWLEQTATGDLQYYRLEATDPADDTLPGLFDRTGFLPVP